MIASPIFFLILVLLPTLLYFSNLTHWWLIQLTIQLLFCLAGLRVPYWRFVAFATLALIILYNHSWIKINPKIPSACQQQVDEFSGVITSGFEESPSQLAFIKVNIWCKGKQVRWPQATLDLSDNKVKKQRWYKLGDRLELARIKIVGTDYPKIYLKPGVRLNIYNISQQERFLHRNAIFWYVQNKANYYLNELNAALFKALVTADRSALSKEWKSHFQDLGITHLFAISGMHIGILYLWISLILRIIISFPLPKIERGYGIIAVDFLTILSIYLYLDLIGMPITASRALIMLTWWIIAKHFISWQPNWFILIGTGHLILVKDPLALGQIAFQLSFLSVAGILAALPYLPKRRLQDSIKAVVSKAVASSVIVSFWLFLLTFPLIDLLAPDHSLIYVVNNVIHILFLSVILVPVLIFAVAFTLLGYPFFGLPGELLIYSAVNLLGNAWIHLLNWNVRWNRLFLWNPEFSWQLMTILVYWFILIMIIQILAQVKERISSNKIK